MKHTIPDAVLAQHTAVLGKTGSGKTSTTKLLVEQVVASGARVCILDTIKSDWWGITSSADGKKAGLPFRILGGPRGHVPLHSSAGKAIGQLVGSGKLPLSIIDMADFEAGGIQRFFVDFAQSLWKGMRGVIYLVIEEAHEVAPKERAGFGAENMAIHWAKKLATGGRSKGIRLVVATQSVQQLHNRVLGSCETMIAHRLTTPADQEPVVKWMKANADKETQQQVDASLASLPTGTGWICSGEAQIFQKIAFPKFWTYDNSATPTDDDTEVQIKTAAVDQDELRSIIGDAVKEAEANDPALLRKRIAALEAEARKAAAATPATKTVERVVEKVVADPKAIAAAEKRGRLVGVSAGTVAGLSRANELLGKHPIRVALEKINEAVEAAVLLSEGRELEADAERAKAAPIAPAPRAVSAKPTAMAVKKIDMPAGGGSLSTPLQKIVDAIAWWNTLGVASPSKPQVAFRAGYAPGGGSFARYMSELRSRQLIDGRSSDGIVLTDAGRAAAMQPDTPATVEALHAAILEQIDAPLVKLLRPLLEAHPEAMTKADLGTASGYEPAGGSFARYLSSLRSLELIEKRGEPRAQNWLFP